MNIFLILFFPGLVAFRAVMMSEFPQCGINKANLNLNLDYINFQMFNFVSAIKHKIPF